MRLKRLVSFFILILLIFSTSACEKVDKIQVKMGLKNEDFNYMKQGKIRKIIIQSTRDRGFRFVVTSPETINEIYDILSSAKIASQKSTLDPDYIFDLYKSDKVKYDSFYYIAGIDKKDGGNLYNNKKKYIVSGRIDNDIIKDFLDIDAKRLPNNFNKVYYPMILQALNQYESSGVDKNKTIGINFKDDVNALKYILSTDIEDFKKKLPSNASIIKDDKVSTDIVEKVETRGYKTDAYKCKITFYDNKTMIQKVYYAVCSYDKGKYSWTISISDSQPANF
ncbi:MULTISPECIES: hypothetical protein [Clostridium]|uniref:hypothetical protein n=1 Tax=Clostridium TaxID=1485 RepID=UPI00069EDDD2|nr:MULTISPECIES: hypothetical protein [Clostridium]KOF57176.1 hypothetical protein AGR56_11890 [Clostridium sp. DMHC 10]MCD2348081.1 hypothetical protein [Clostridium guangxiense]